MQNNLSQGEELVMEIKKDPIKRGGKFQKGQSGNPAGRKTNPEITRILMEFKDRRNNFTLALFDRIESVGDALISRAIDMAMEGNERMMFFLFDKCINSNLLSRLEKPLLSRTAEDIDNSQQFVIEKMGEGTIDASHGLNLVRTLSLKRDTINVRKLEEDVTKIVGGDAQ